MPQLQQIDTFYSQIFWLFVCLGIVYFYMHKVVVPRLSGVIKKREETISGHVNEAEFLRDKAKKENTDYSNLFVGSKAKAMAVISEANVQANAAYEKGITEAENKLKKDIATAEKDISLEVEKAASDLNKNLLNYIIEVVEKLSGAGADKAAIDKIIAKIK